MPKHTLQVIAEFAGVYINAGLQRATTGQVGHEVSLPAAKAGTLAVRTSDTVGTLTLGLGHGFATNDVLDLYWAGGRQFGAIVGVVSGQDVPIESGVGDALPPAGTAITAGKPTTIDLRFAVGSKGIAALQCANRAHLHFNGTGPETNHHVDLNAGEPRIWTPSLGGDPFDAIIQMEQLFASQDSAAGPATLRVGVGINSA